MSRWVCLLLALSFFSGAARAERPDPRTRGVFFQERDGAFFRIQKKVDQDPGLLDSFGRPLFPKEPEFEIVPTRIVAGHATPGGRVDYPSALTFTFDNIPENDPITGKWVGPAGLSSRFDVRTGSFSVFYSNGVYTRKQFFRRVPGILSQVESALTDLHSNVFWMVRALDGSIRIFHESAEAGKVPLNELLFGGPVRKVRADPTGMGLVLLLETGQVLKVEVPEDFSLHVTRINDPGRFRVLDLETGPLGEDPFEHGLVLYGADLQKGQIGLRVHEGMDITQEHPVPMSYFDPFRRAHAIEFIEGIYGNSHAVELSRLVDRTPRELNRFLQKHYELRQEEIELLLHSSGTQGSLTPVIGRRVILHEEAPGLCRFYLLPHYGLSPNLFLN